MSNTNSSAVFCSESYQSFGYAIEPCVFHLNLLLCLVGIPLNLLSCVIYLQKDMRRLLWSVLLAAISFADSIVMIAFIINYVGIVLGYTNEHYSYFQAVTWIVHEYFNTVFHHMSIWFTTALATFRWIAISFPIKFRQVGRRSYALGVMAVITVVNLLVTIQGYVDASIEPCGHKYCPTWKPLNFLRRVEFWYQGISRVIPAIWLTYVTVVFIKSLRASVKLRASSSLENSSQNFQRTTKMMLVLLLLFLVTEVPPSFLLLLESFYDAQFFTECRRPVQVLIWCMYYLNSVANVVVYYVLNQQYRAALRVVFLVSSVQSTDA